MPSLEKPTKSDHHQTKIGFCLFFKILIQATVHGDFIIVLVQAGTYQVLGANRNIKRRIKGAFITLDTQFHHDKGPVRRKGGTTRVRVIFLFEIAASQSASQIQSGVNHEIAIGKGGHFPLQLIFRY